MKPAARSADVQVDVAIVGAGPAGAVLAARLAGAGVEVVVLERSPAWHWRASGVFASPAAVDALQRAGLEEPAIAAVARPIPAMRLETPGGALVRLTYGADDGGPPAVGLDRSRLDPALVDVARAAGAEVRLGQAVEAVRFAGGARALARLLTRSSEGQSEIRARVVVGADGAHSIVARAAGVLRPTRLPPRIGLSYHLPDGRADGPLDARMRVLRDGYVGIAPVPGGRVNVGIVLGSTWRADLARDGAARTAAAIVAAIPAATDDPATWRHASPCEPIAGTSPLGGRVTRRAGTGWLLVGDAAGFLDPFTGEGLHRALVSTELAAPAIRAQLRGDARGAAAYDRAMQRRFATKDLVSWLVQGFLARPAAFEYAARRLAARPDVRATMGLVMGDLVPANRALDPRFLAMLLAP
jgi:menaquinone-9 beta-reductase